MSGSESGKAQQMKKLTGKSRTLSMIVTEKAETMSKMASFVDLAMDDDDLKEDTNPRGTVVTIDGQEGESGTDLLERAIKDEDNKGAVHVAETVGHVAGMDSNTLQRVALEDEWQMVSCASLPFTMVFFLIFTFFFQQHYGITDIFLAEVPVRKRIGEPAINLESAVDIYSWLQEAYLPYLWGAKHENFIRQRLNTTSLFQEVIGGVRFTITEAQVQPCDTFKDMDCHNGVVDVVGGGHFGRRLAPSAFPVSSQPLQFSTQEVSSSDQYPRSSEGSVVGERPVSANWAAWRAKKRGRAGGRSSSPSFKRRLADKGHQRPRRVQGVFSEALARPVSKARSLNRRTEDEARRLKYTRPEIKVESPKADSGNRSQVSRTDDEARRLRYTRPEIKVEAPKADSGNRSQVVLPISTSLKEALAEVDRWQQNAILNGRTLAFRTEVLLLNSNLGQDRQLVSQVFIEFGFHRGGLVFGDVQIITLVLTALATDGIQAFLAILWVLGLIVFSGMLASRAYVRYLQGRLVGHLSRFWNWVEWLMVLWGWFTLFSFSVERGYIWGLKAEIDEHQENRQSLPPWERTKFDMAAVPDILETANAACSVSMWVQLVVALFHIVIAFRFFLASRGQPRLAIVLNTIRKATSDLMHLLIVFLLIFLGYAVSGHLLFGRRMHEFATFSGSFASCFQIVMEREYPWTRFTLEDQWTATLWVWTFLVLIVLVLVNIFLAMLFDTYGEVRAGGGHSATLWQTTKIVIEHGRRLFRCKEAEYGSRWVANREIIHAVKMMQSDVVTPWMVMDCFPGISVRQVNYLFNLAKNRFETSLLQSSKSSLPPVIASILLAVERMYEKLTDLLLLTEHDEEEQATATSGTSEATPIKEHSRTEILDAVNFSNEPSSPKTDRSGSFRRRRRAKKEAPPPGEKPPNWQKIQLMPHIKKQQIMLSQVQQQIKRIRTSQHLLGKISDEGVPPAPIQAPLLLQTVSALGGKKKDHYPLGPQSANLHVVPASARSGMTQASQWSLPMEHGFELPINGVFEPPEGKSKSVQ